MTADNGASSLPSNDVLQRYASKRKLDKITRAPWRHRSKRKILQRTPAEKATLKARRKAHREDFHQALQEASAAVVQTAADLEARFPSHNQDYYRELLMQQTRRPQTTRAVNQWNAFVSKDLKAKNDQLPEGEPRQRATREYLEDARERWNAMTKEEKLAEVEEHVKKLTERREMKKYSQQSVGVSAFNDTRSTLASLESELSALNARTGTEILLFAVRSSVEHFNRPFVYCSNPRLSEFVEVTTRASVQELALRMEGFCLAGLEEQFTNRGQISRMVYNNFDTTITHKYGIIIENWPLPKFCCPSDIGSRPELEVLYHAWDSGTTRFKELSDEEWQQWRGAQFEEKMDEMMGDEDAGDSEPNASTANQEPAPITPTSTAAATTNDAMPLVDSTNTPGAKRAAPSEADNAPQRKRAKTTGVVSGLGGTGVAVTKKPRKTRSDKGVKRGSRAKASAQASSSPPSSAPTIDLSGASTSAVGTSDGGNM
ncbi:hypothetical protein B0H21DRAFT_697389 [Amylocystis lapponica]|nr:hypothetical protein B0H21DRAFT_697389 [Amylocystis lapponica]